MIGILGALVLRAGMILVGAWLITQFHWVLYLFGAFLVFTGVKMWWAAGQEPDSKPTGTQAAAPAPSHLAVVRRRALHDAINGIRHFTPLFVVIVLIGIVDVIFAVDSIPAIFA